MRRGRASESESAHVCVRVRICVHVHVRMCVWGAGLERCCGARAPALMPMPRGRAAGMAPRRGRTDREGPGPSIPPEGRDPEPLRDGPITHSLPPSLFQGGERGWRGEPSRVSRCAVRIVPSLPVSPRGRPDPGPPRPPAPSPPPPSRGPLCASCGSGCREPVMDAASAQRCLCSSCGAGVSGRATAGMRVPSDARPPAA